MVEFSQLQIGALSLVAAEGYRGYHCLVTTPQEVLQGQWYNLDPMTKTVILYSQEPYTFTVVPVHSIALLEVHQGPETASAHEKSAAARLITALAVFLGERLCAQTRP